MCLDCGHHGLNFSFKIEFEKNPEIFLACLFFLGLHMKCLSKCPNSKKTPLPRQIPDYAPVL